MEAPRPLPGSRRHLGARHLARGLRLGALTLALLGPVAAPAGAATGPGVFFAGPNVSVSEAQIKAAEQPGREYTLRSTPGEAGQSVSRPGVPVRKVLEMAGVSFTAGYLTVPRQNGTSAYLPAADFDDPSPFEEGKPALISVDSGTIHFFRPVIGAGANAEDNITTVAGEGLTIGVHGGHVVEVRVTPASASTTAGSPVAFTASIVGGGEFDFTWSFGDGTTKEGETVSHPFAGSGTYLVRVTATGTGGDESGGESPPVEVVVGNPPTTAAPGATTTPPPPAAQPTGAPGTGREGQGGKGSKPKPSGERKPPKPKRSKDDSATQRAASPRSRSHPEASSEPSAPAPSPSPTPEASPTVPALPEEASGGDSAEPPGCCSAESPPEASPSPSTSHGELVEGRLVGDDLGPVTVAEPSGGGAEGEGSRSAAGAVGGGGDGAPVVALIVVALLAGGALFEWRCARPVR